MRTTNFGVWPEVRAVDDRRIAGGWLAATGLLLSLPLHATTFERQSSTWDTGRAAMGWEIAMSSDGRYVAFASDSTRIVSGDTNGRTDVFLRDRETGTTVRVSVSSTGAQANGSSAPPFGSVTPDGRYVTFMSSASNLVPGDTNEVGEVFLRDTAAGTTERVGVSSSGVQGNNESIPWGISDDGRFVLFESAASNLVAGESRAATVYLRDRLNHTTRVAGLADRTAQCGSGALSADGSVAAFTCRLAAAGSASEVYVRNFNDDTIEKVSTYRQAAENLTSVQDLSADGRYLLLTTDARVLAWDTNGVGGYDAYLYDRATKAFELISVTKKGVSGNNSSSSGSISDDGRFVGFGSWARDLVDNPQGNAFDGFVRDRTAGTTTRVTVTNRGAGCCTYWGLRLSADGRKGLFTSDYNFVANDANDFPDVFVATGFGPASFTVRPRTLAFGTVAVGSSSASQTVTVTNTGSSGLAIAWVGLAGDDPTQFARVRNCPQVLPAGQQCTATVTFVPTASGGHEAKLVVSAGDTRKSTAVSGFGE